MTKKKSPSLLPSIILIPLPGTKYSWDPQERTLRREGSLPSAVVNGADINEFVAWDGNTYVLRPTKESVLADERLKLIGSVRELSRVRRLEPGFVIFENLRNEELPSEFQDKSEQSAEREGQSREANRKNVQSGFARKIDELRRECGWSLNDLENATGLDKKLISGHVSGKGMHPRTLKKYADTFSKELDRKVTVAELRGSGSLPK
jgi:hypothetical protein